ncbi:MAG TPA: N-acetylmuramoyl-L-alanine amidase, partial [Candidatus Ozemobacteraceae bacterium]|nr:N-acetylmuramoyl-L-alanine amidase [Candidatus Ozemobacteraceae bacterium]
MIQFNHRYSLTLRTICALLLVLLPQLLGAQEQRITDIRFWQSPEEAQVVVDMTEFPKVSPMETLPDGTFFFEIDTCKFRPGRASYPLNNQFLNAITVQERTTGTVRIYFRVPAGIQYRTFLLPKNQVKPDRIVIFLSEPTQVVEMRRQEEIQEVTRLRADGQVKVVVIDAGHGGEDPGARHNGVIEKNYVLYMAKLVKSVFDKDPR